jgi:prolyl-tRNA synthetase
VEFLLDTNQVLMIISFSGFVIGKKLPICFHQLMKKRSPLWWQLLPNHIETFPLGSFKSVRLQDGRKIRSLTRSVARKYRDEPRPRQGLLRTREFVMKDLYTFDCNAREALTTYNDVRDAYIRLFDSFRIPYIVANADSGNMGGNLSHEFHLPSSNGEDNVITCGSCGYAANEEVAKSRIQQSSKDLTETIPHRFGNQASTADTETSLEKTSGVGISQDPFAAEIGLWTTTTKDRKNLVNVLYPKQSKGDSGSNSSQIQHQGINIHRIRKLVPGIETSLEDPVALWRQSFQNQAASTEQEAGIHPDSNIINIFDYRLSSNLYTSTFSNHSDIPTSAKLQGYFSKQIPTTTISQDPDSGEPLDVLKIKNDDNCPQCSTGLLRVHKAVELGHNFFLGTRYSEPLGATISNMESDATEDQLPESTQAKETRQALQMGCHGIGVSRMIGAFADVLADEKGLNWPRVMAPYEAIILPNKGFEEAALEVYDTLAQVTAPSMGFQSVDVILDDRTKSLAWKLQDADLIGVPLIIIVGRAWKANRKCEIQCRRLKIKGMEVSLDQLQESVDSMLDRL